MVISVSPLKFEFLDVNGEVAVVLNDNNQLMVEPLRVRRERIGDDDEGNVDVSVAFVCHFMSFDVNIANYYFYLKINCLFNMIFWQ